jgi:hypothetical protein
MYEHSKIQEATYFLHRMEDCLSEPEPFKYNLSAFLSAARTVAQYACKDARGKQGGQAWYDQFVSSHALVGFFANERNANTHDAPAAPDGYVDIYARDAGVLGETERLETFDTAGNLVDVVEPPSPDLQADPAPAFRFHFVYRFAGWGGQEDVVTLSSEYLKDLRALVAEGLARGFLTT